ncbi:sigma-70 family RNA polymerase sigma factor [Roseateles aquatilis]|uniref:sigma-70 family RNA polymerase sigma factor n=1 Tax=Roseateles aquatilis TaxID=431061 RepID=UPI001EDF9126|nr:sigma-70 family RNA polymerase sigma factor [Roseateles aquatilis]
MLSPHPLLHDQFHDWYSGHHRWLHAWLSRRLGCPHRAADVAHNTFLRLLSARDALLGVQQPRAWLTTTARRLIVDEVRHQRIEQAYLDELTALTADGAGAPSPEQILDAVQALMQLSAILDTVAPKARTAFLRHYLDDEPQAVVAEELGVSVRMVRKYLAQVLLECGMASMRLSA